MTGLGRMLITVGLITALAGILILLGDRLPILGKLPGDILIKKGNFTFFSPITTSILLGVAVSLILWIFRSK
jgi:hypothetical protein